MKQTNEAALISNRENNYHISFETRGIVVAVRGMWLCAKEGMRGQNVTLWEHHGYLFNL